MSSPSWTALAGAGTRGSPFVVLTSALTQILDVLIDNADRHRTGTITVTVSTVVFDSGAGDEQTMASTGQSWSSKPINEGQGGD